MTRALIGLGSNLGDRRAAIASAIEHLRSHAGIDAVTRVSTLRETEPVGGPLQGRYLNGVLALETRLSARELLEALLAIEASLGRTRAEANGPRTIDLDLLLFGDAIIDEPGLRVPHPRIAERLFVLDPLAEIAAEFVHPESGRTFETLRAERSRVEGIGAQVQNRAGKPAMRELDDAHRVRDWTEAYRRAGLSIGFVPTLGALHAGHAALLERARTECDRVVASIYLNPTQFDSAKDLDRYPSVPDADREICARAGVDLLWFGSREDLLPPGFQTWVQVEDLTRSLCGAGRPGHFRGVATIVSQLFLVVRPHRAYFGLKDFQQSRVVSRLVRDLGFDLEIRLVETVREADGLAMSSRNARLSPEARAAAPAIYRALRATEHSIEAGERSVREVRTRLSQELAREPRLEVEYAEVLRADTLLPFEEDRIELAASGVLLAVAARLDGVRLIDNLRLGGQEGSPSMGAEARDRPGGRP